MCLVAIYYRVAEDAPLVVGANREEQYARGGEPPQHLHGPIRAVGGRDPVAGGTWLGVNERGVLVAVTNRPRSPTPDRPRSRGLLVRDLLGCPTAAAAVEQATQALATRQYAGCNLLCADADRAVVLLNADWLRVRPLPPGIHVLAGGEVDDENDPRLYHALTWLHQRPHDTADDCLDALRDLCADAGNGGPAICLHGSTGGTVSSTLIALRPPPAPSLYLHAQGPPDRVPYRDYSHLLGPDWLPETINRHG
jgi:uncharacterized protein with NRDE domain